MNSSVMGATGIGLVIDVDTGFMNLCPSDVPIYHENGRPYILGNGRGWWVDQEGWNEIWRLERDHILAQRQKDAAIKAHRRAVRSEIIQAILIYSFFAAVIVAFCFLPCLLILKVLLLVVLIILFIVVAVITIPYAAAAFVGGPLLVAVVCIPALLLLWAAIAVYESVRDHGEPTTKAVEVGHR